MSLNPSAGTATYTGSAIQDCVKGGETIASAFDLSGTSGTCT